MIIQSNGFMSILDIHFGKKCNNRLDDIEKTLKNKFEQILLKCIEEEIKVIIIAGDIFENCSIDRKTFMLAYEIFKQFKDHNIQIFTIYGNHDEYRYNKTFRELTPLNDLVKLEVIQTMDSKCIITENNGVQEYGITGFDYLDTNKLKFFLKVLAKDKERKTVVVGHCFYENDFMGGEFNLTKEEINNCNLDYLILGHDHSRYNKELCNKTNIFRNGSLIRDSSSKNDTERIPSVLIFKKKNNSYSVEEYMLKCEKLQSIISTKNIVNKEQNKINFKEMVESIKIDKETKEKDLVLEAINNLENEKIKETIKRYL